MAEYFNQIDKYPLSKAVVLPNGFVRFVAPIARVTKPNERGFLNINRADGKPYYQKITKDVLERTKDSFLSIPTTLKHPPEFVNSVNGRTYTRGLTGSSKNSIIQIDNYQFCTGTIFDEELIKAIKDQVAREISPGYKVSLSPLQEDTCEQTDRLGNHVAFLPMGRQGSNVSLQLDESEINWDFSSDFQFDEAELAEIKKEILALPEGYLDLSYFPDKIILNQSDKVENRGTMNKLQLVTDQDVVVTLESEQCDQIANYVDRLKKKSEELAIKLSSSVSKEQIDSANEKLQELSKENDRLKSQQTDGSAVTVATLEAQIEALKIQLTDKPKEQTDQSAIQSEAQKLALDFMRTAPIIYKYDPEFQFDSVPSLVELHRSCVMLAYPEKAEEFKNLQLDESAQGQINTGKIQGYFEALSLNSSKKEEQIDNKENFAFNSAFRSILQHGEQRDTSEEDRVLETARDSIANAWKQ